MHLIEKAALFTEITVEETATVSGGAVDVGSSLGNQLVSQASVYYEAVIAANSSSSQSSSNITALTTTSTDLLPALRVNSAGAVGLKSN